MFLSIHSAVLSASPAPFHPTWCADVNQTLYVNGSATQSQSFHLCLDSTPGSLRWSQSGMHPGVTQYFNGTTRFDVTPNGTGTPSCVETYFGPGKASQLPWAFTKIDDNAVFNRTEHNVDGFKDVNVWTVFRPAHPPPVKTPAMTMEWRVENTSSTVDKEFLSSSSIQTDPHDPSKMQDGVRDFSANYTTPAPKDSFSPPAGLKCTAAPGSKPFEPDDGCKPTCASGSLCCRDPNVPPPGTCFGVTDCSQIHGRELLGQSSYAAIAATFMTPRAAFGA